MLWRTVGFLAVTLQRQHFQVLQGCAPTLGAQVAGRLGRPLSKVPEFWRAAPEVAQHWAAEEFDFPPDRLDPQGALVSSPGEAEPELGFSGVGHLRAAGLRL